MFCISAEERLFHTVSCVSNSLALVVGGRTSPSSTGLGMLWLKFHETCNALDPSDITVKLVSLQPAAEPAALRWRHSTTEVMFKGKKPGNGCRHAEVYKFQNKWDSPVQTVRSKRPVVRIQPYFLVMWYRL